MAEVGVDKLDESNDSIKLNGVPSDTNLIFEKENESGLDDEQGSCVSRKRLNSNEISNVDKLADSSSVSSITDKSTNALANGHLRVEPATSECDSGAAGRISPAASAAQTTCCRTPSGKDARPADEDKSVISNGEESNSDSSSIVDSASHVEMNCSAEQPRMFESIGMESICMGAMPLDFAPKEIARTNSGLSITMVSTPKPSDEQNSRWDRGGANDELRKTDTMRSDASGGGGGGHHPSSEVSIKEVVDNVTAGNTPDKQHKKYKKSLPALNITPRRSSRNINKLRSYNDKDGEIYEDGSPDGGVQIRKSTNDDDDIEEITPTDPLADDSGRSKLRNKTIVVSDTKGLVEFATNARISSKCNKKEPTLVIIDTKSILSGRGPVPVSQSPGGGGGGGGGGTPMLHPIGSSTPIPVSLPISGSPLNNTPRGLSVSSSAFSVIPIGLPTQNLYPQFRNPPPQIKPIIVGPASTTVTPVSVQQQSSSSLSSSHNIGGSSSSASVTALTVPAPATKQPSVVLPSLTDDMFVVEAPSFIVPYVYEKPPMKALKEYIEKIQTVIKEAEEKEAEEEKSRLEALEKERVEAQEKEKSASEAGEEQDEADQMNTAKKEKSDDKVEEEEENGSIAEQTESASAVGEAAEAVKGDEEKSEKSEVYSAKKEDEDAKSATEKPESMEVCSEESERASSASGAATNEVTSDKGKATAESGAAEAGKKDAPETAAPKDDSKKSTSVVDDSKKPPSFFDNPLGKFFIQIGLNLVQEHVQTDLLRSQKRKRDKEGENCSPEVHATISELTRTLESSKENNDPFKLNTKKCELCSFRTESLLVMAHHLETPHMKNYTYRCNFCPLEVRSPHDILFHMEAEHNVRGRLERAPAFHQCANCPFEDNQKGKLTRHMVSCLKKYRSEKNQEPPLDWEPPAKIPRVTRNRPPSMSPGNAVYQAAMSGLKQVPQNTLLPKLMPNATNVKQNMMGANKRPNTVNAGFVGRFPNANTQPNFQQRPISIQNSNQGIMYRTPLTNSQTPVMLPQNYQFSTSTATLYQSSSVKQSQQGLTAAKLMNQPSISITPLPRQSSSSQQGSSSSNAVMNSTSQGGKGGKSAGTASAASSNSKNSFVVCEICDGYIKDLEQLRNHMQWIHKVKIHPKMIYNRPPLNCQKCQYRFFTDQGLERHLLGSHGLVTSSMQEAANKGKDGGRCPVCGRVYQWKLLNHVARDHQMALKPAHLSYKCTVCTATFGMYKQFESHVYSAHSVVAKRAMDPKKPPMSSQNDALLKPLKINDEITIIPQPVRQTKPMNKMIVNTRSKDGGDDKFCARKCTPPDFSTVEEFERHLLAKHARPFRVEITRVDAKLPDRCAVTVGTADAAAAANEPPELAATACVLDRPSGSCELPPTQLQKQYELKSLQIRLPKLSFLREHHTYKVQMRRGKRKDDDKEADCVLADSFLQASMKVDESRSVEIAFDNSSSIPSVYNMASGPKTQPTEAVSALLAQASTAFQSIGAMADSVSFGNHFLTNGDTRPAQSNSATSRPPPYVPIAAARKQPSEGSCVEDGGGGGGGKPSSSVSRAVSFSTAYATDATNTHPVVAFSNTCTAPRSSPSVRPAAAAGGIVRTIRANRLTAASPSFVFRPHGSSTFIPVSVIGNRSGGNTVRLLHGRAPFRIQSPSFLVSVPPPIASPGAAARVRIRKLKKKPPPPSSPADEVIVLTSSDSDDVDDGAGNVKDGSEPSWSNHNHA